MSIYQMVRSSFFHFKDLANVRKTPFGKIIFYLVLLSFLFAIPMTSQVMTTFHAIRHDGQKIAKKIPDFSIQNQQLTTTSPTNGFIYQSDTLIFTFDPEGKRTVNDVAGDHLGNLFSVGLLKNELVVSFPSNEVSADLLGSGTFKTTYANPMFENLTGTSLREGLANNQISWVLYIIIFLIAIYPAFLNLVMTLLFASFFANIWVKFRDPSFHFLDTFKTMIISATVPTLISTLILFYDAAFNTGTFIFLGTIFLFLQMVRHLPKQTKTN